jgi:hypothetical protein
MSLAEKQSVALRVLPDCVGLSRAPAGDTFDDRRAAFQSASEPAANGQHAGAARRDSPNGRSACREFDGANKSARRSVYVSLIYLRPYRPAYSPDESRRFPRSFVLPARPHGLEDGRAATIGRVLASRRLCKSYQYSYLALIPLTLCPSLLPFPRRSDQREWERHAARLIVCPRLGHMVGVFTTESIARALREDELFARLAQADIDQVP